MWSLQVLKYITEGGSNSKSIVQIGGHFAVFFLDYSVMLQLKSVSEVITCFMSAVQKVD